MIYVGQNIIRGGFAMKKFIRLLGFALLLVLIAFVGLIAYQVNFDLNAVLSYFITIGISVVAPMINFSQITLLFALTIGGSALYLIFMVILFVSLLRKLKIISAVMTLLGLTVTLSFALLSINGYFPDATSLENLGDPSNFIEILLIPIQNPNPGLRASAFSGLVVTIVFFTLMFVIMNIIELFRHPFTKQSSQVIPILKEETVIAQELSKFVIPSQIRLPQTEVPLQNQQSQPSNNALSSESQSLLEQTPIVALPQSPVLPEKQDIVKARQTVLQIKERIRSQIRLQLLEAKQFASNTSTNGNITPPTPTPISQPTVEPLVSQATAPETTVNELFQVQIQEKVNKAIAAEIAQLEPKTKDQVNTLINEELIKYDSLNREVMESLVSEKIEQILTTTFEQFRQEMEAMVLKSIQALETSPKQLDQNQTPSLLQEKDIEEQVRQILRNSDLSKKVESIENSMLQTQNSQAINSASVITIPVIETLIEKQTNPLMPLLDKVNLLQQQLEQLTQSIPHLEKVPFVKQEVYDTQAEQLKQIQQRLIQLQQDLVSSKGTLDQFQIETLSRSNSIQEKISDLEIKQLQKAPLNEVIDENAFVSLVKKHQSIIQPELPIDVVKSLISNEIKKQLVPTPTLSKDEVKKMIEEAIKALPLTNVTTPEIDESKLADRVQAKLPKTLTESDVQTIVKSTIPTQPTLNEGLVLGLISNEIKKQLVQTPTLSKDEVKKMIEEAIDKLPLTNFATGKAIVSQNDQPPSTSSTIPFDMVVPVIKKKNARAPENEKRAEQFKSVMTPDLGVTRTGKKKIIRIPFQERMAKADPMMLGHYDELKNYILSYQVKSRISNTGDMFRLHKEEFVKITIAGKSLKLYMALNPEDYKDSPIPV
ncbi:MAG: hypothetical protein RLZZ264_63, partial [Bacillota bacterium]